jgi:hypothetical protein
MVFSYSLVVSKMWIWIHEILIYDLLHLVISYSAFGFTYVFV